MCIDIYIYINGRKNIQILEYPNLVHSKLAKNVDDENDPLYDDDRAALLVRKLSIMILKFNEVGDWT